MMQFFSTPATHHHPPPLLSLPLPLHLDLPLPSCSSLSFASYMEQLLVHCILAMDRNDSTLTHQILWVLKTLASPDGDSTPCLVSAFLRSLISGASRSGSGASFHHLFYPLSDPSLDHHRFSSPTLPSP